MDLEWVNVTAGWSTRGLEKHVIQEISNKNNELLGAE